MIKKLLFLSAIAASTFTTAQTLESENFNDLELGNVNTVTDFSARGQGNYLTSATNVDQGATEASTSDNAGNDNFQIVTGGFGRSQGLRLVGPNGNQGARQILKFPFDQSSWADREDGNNIIEAEYMFNTGDATTSTSTFRTIVSGDDGETTQTTLVGLEYDTATQELRGLARLDNNGSIGLFNFNLGPGNTDLILESNTWVKVGFSYDSETGQVRWRTGDNGGNVNATFTNEAFVRPGLVPTSLRTIVFTAADNTSAGIITYDNFDVTAVASDMLLNNEEVVQAISIRLYPNPAVDMVNIVAQDDAAISNVSIIDMSGKTLINQAINGNEAQINVSALSTGIYFVQVSNNDGATSVQKIIKK